MAAMVWTEDLEDQLIALVEERPALWNIPATMLFQQEYQGQAVP